MGGAGGCVHEGAAVSKTKETIKKYTDAATVDILGFLHVSEPHIFDFRRIQTIAAAMTRLIGSIGTPAELIDTADAMRAMEGVSENLHHALEGHAFDGEELLRKKYQELHEFHRDLSQRKLDMEEAHSLLSLAKDKMTLQRRLLDEQATHIERERERLQLQASTAGKMVDLPPMPVLGVGDDDDDIDAEEEERRDNEDTDATPVLDCPRCSGICTGHDEDDTGSVPQPRVRSTVVRENY